MSGRLIDVSESAFAVGKKRATPGPFYEDVKRAMDNPEKVVEIEVPSGMNRGQVFSQLSKAAKYFPYRLCTRAANELFDRGVVQVMRGKLKADGSRVDVGEPDKEFKIARHGATL